MTLRTLPALTFGVEIETVNASESSLVRALQGAGLLANQSERLGRGYTQWQVKYDGSLSPTSGRDHHYSAEIVSPVLRWGNPDDMRQIQRAMDAVNNIGGGMEARVNKTTGLHCHVGIAGFSRTEILGIVDVYTAYQTMIEREVLAPSRIGGRWAKSYATWDRETRARHDERFIESGRVSDRYMTVNLTRVNDIGTVEFRQRQGTTNARKILTWAGMCVNMVAQGRDVANGGAVLLGSDLASSLRAQRVDSILEAMLSGEFSLAGLPTPTPSLSQLLRLQGLEG